MYNSYCLWIITHIWIAQVIAVCLIVSSGFKYGRYEHVDKSLFSAVLGLFGCGFLVEIYLLSIGLLVAPLVIIIMCIASVVLWYAGFDEGRFRQFGRAMIKLFIGLIIMLSLFRFLSLGKFG